MSDLPQLGAVVWMRTHGKSARARIESYTSAPGRRPHTVTLRFDDAVYGDNALTHGVRRLYVAAFRSALEKVQA